MLNTVEAMGSTSAMFTPAVAARYAVAVEQAAKQALATLEILKASEFLDSVPPGIEARETYIASLTLLDCAHRSLAAALADDAGETALIDLADELRRAVRKGA